MGNENKDVLRVQATYENMPSTLLSKQWGYVTDRYQLAMKEADETVRYVPSYKGSADGQILKMDSYQLEDSIMNESGGTVTATGNLTVTSGDLTINDGDIIIDDAGTLTDYTTITGTADGGLTITTLDAEGSDADLTLAADGNVIINGATGMGMSTTAGDISIAADEDLKLYWSDGTVDFSTDIAFAYTNDITFGGGNYTINADGSFRITPSSTNDAYISVADSGEIYQYFQNSTTGDTDADGSRIGLDANENLIIEQLGLNDIWIKTASSTGRVYLDSTTNLVFDGDGSMNDYISFVQGNNGDLTIETVDAGGAEADLTLTIDGAFGLTTAADEDITLTASGTGNINITAGASIIATSELQIDSDSVGIKLGDGQTSEIIDDGTNLTIQGNGDIILDPGDDVLIGATGTGGLQAGNIGVGVAPSSDIGVYSDISSTTASTNPSALTGVLRWTPSADASAQTGYGLNFTQLFSGAEDIKQIINTLQVRPDSYTGTVQDVAGLKLRVLKQAGGDAAVSNNLIGLWVDVEENDFTVDGTSYMIYLEETGFPDYGIYQDGSATNLLGGALYIDSDSAGIKLGDGQTSEIIDDGTDLTIQGNGDIIINPDSDIVKLDFGTQDYKILQASGESVMRIESATSGEAFGLYVASADGDGTDSVYFAAYGVGNSSDNTNRERLLSGYNADNTQFELWVEANGTGTLRDLVLYTEGNTDQLKLNADGSIDINGNLVCNNKLNLDGQTELTISGGAITITSSFHTVDTESNDATDDLDTINGGAEGDILILRSANNARDVTVKDATGNLKLAGDFTLGEIADTIMLLYSGSNWLELSRSNNT